MVASCRSIPVGKSSLILL
uniref:Uncharacterized protein n=1 Tax=Anguilla anguilla TaxID=7936 RepID=A0A0E9VY68_ANGAN